MTTPEPGDPDYLPPPVDYPAHYPDPPAYPPPYPAPAGPGYYAAPYADPYDPYRTPPPRGTNGLAIASLATSIAGVVLAIVCCGGGFILPIVAIVLGIVALNQIKNTHAEGRGMAIAGIVIGTMALALAVILVVFALTTGYFDSSTV